MVGNEKVSREGVPSPILFVISISGVGKTVPQGSRLPQYPDDGVIQSELTRRIVNSAPILQVQWVPTS